jgi:hypothetical protein
MGKKKEVKSKAIPITGRGGLWGCETLKIPHFLDSLCVDGSEVVSLMCWQCFISQEDPGTHFC